VGARLAREEAISNALTLGYIVITFASSPPFS